MAAKNNDTAIIEDLAWLSMDVLMVKYGLAEKIRADAEAAGDPRHVVPARQARLIKAAMELKQKRAGAAKPPPVVIQMQPLRMKAMRLGLSE